MCRYRIIPSLQKKYLFLRVLQIKIGSKFEKKSLWFIKDSYWIKMYFWQSMREMISQLIFVFILHIFSGKSNTVVCEASWNLKLTPERWLVNECENTDRKNYFFSQFFPQKLTLFLVWKSISYTLTPLQRGKIPPKRGCSRCDANVLLVARLQFLSSGECDQIDLFANLY